MGGSGSHIGIGRVTRGLGSRTPDQGESRATFGLIGSVDLAAAIEIIPKHPLPFDVDIDRAGRFFFLVRDPNLPLEIDTLNVSYRQEPYPAESVDGWVPVIIGGVFQPGFDGSGSGISVGVYVHGQQASVEVQPLFGLLPGSVGSLHVLIEDNLGAQVSLTWTFEVLDNALSMNMREHFYKFKRQAERYGWDALIVANQTYDFDADPDVTGSALEVDVNESLAADFGDQMNSSPLGLDILNNVRRYRLLAKPIEYPRDSSDPTAATLHDDYISAVPSPVFVDRKVPGVQVHEEFTEGDRIEREFRYYTLFILVPPQEDNLDWFWAYADSSTFARAFSYGRYGHGDKMYDLMIPEAWKIIDGELP